MTEINYTDNGIDVRVNSTGNANGILYPRPGDVINFNVPKDNLRPQVIDGDIIFNVLNDSGDAVLAQISISGGALLQMSGNPIKISDSSGDNISFNDLIAESSLAVVTRSRQVNAFYTGSINETYDVDNPESELLLATKEQVQFRGAKPIVVLDLKVDLPGQPATVVDPLAYNNTALQNTGVGDYDTRFTSFIVDTRNGDSEFIGDSKIPADLTTSTTFLYGGYSSNRLSQGIMNVSVYTGGSLEGQQSQLTPINVDLTSTPYATLVDGRSSGNNKITKTVELGIPDAMIIGTLQITLSNEAVRNGIILETYINDQGVTDRSYGQVNPLGNGIYFITAGASASSIRFTISFREGIATNGPIDFLMSSKVTYNDKTTGNPGEYSESSDILIKRATKVSDLSGATTVFTDTMPGVNVNGNTGAYDDVIYGGSAGNLIYSGGALNGDTVYTGQGDDVVYSGYTYDSTINTAVASLNAGANSIYGSLGNDVIIGADTLTKQSTLYYGALTSSISLSVSNGAGSSAYVSKNVSSGGTDSIRNISIIYMTAYNDSLFVYNNLTDTTGSGFMVIYGSAYGTLGAGEVNTISLKPSGGVGTSTNFFRIGANGGNVMYMVPNGGNPYISNTNSTGSGVSSALYYYNFNKFILSDTADYIYSDNSMSYSIDGAGSSSTGKNTIAYNSIGNLSGNSIIFYANTGIVYKGPMATSYTDTLTRFTAIYGTGSTSDIFYGASFESMSYNQSSVSAAGIVSYEFATNGITFDYRNSASGTSNVKAYKGDINSNQVDTFYNISYIYASLKSDVFYMSTTNPDNRSIYGSPVASPLNRPSQGDIATYYTATNTNSITFYSDNAPDRFSDPTSLIPYVTKRGVRGIDYFYGFAGEDVSTFNKFVGTSAADTFYFSMYTQSVVTIYVDGGTNTNSSAQDSLYFINTASTDGRGVSIFLGDSNLSGTVVKDKYTVNFTGINTIYGTAYNDVFYFSATAVNNNVTAYGTVDGSATTYAGEVNYLSFASSTFSLTDMYGVGITIYTKTTSGPIFYYNDARITGNAYYFNAYEGSNNSDVFYSNTEATDYFFSGAGSNSTIQFETNVFGVRYSLSSNVVSYKRVLTPYGSSDDSGSGVINAYMGLGLDGSGNWVSSGAAGSFAGFGSIYKNVSGVYTNFDSIQRINAIVGGSSGGNTSYFYSGAGNITFNLDSGTNNAGGSSSLLSYRYTSTGITADFGSMKIFKANGYTDTFFTSSVTMYLDGAVGLGNVSINNTFRLATNQYMDGKTVYLNRYIDYGASPKPTTSNIIISFESVTDKVNTFTLTSDNYTMTSGSFRTTFYWDSPTTVGFIGSAYSDTFIANNNAFTASTAQGFVFNGGVNRSTNSSAYNENYNTLRYQGTATTGIRVNAAIGQVERGNWASTNDLVVRDTITSIQGFVGTDYGDVFYVNSGNGVGNSLYTSQTTYVYGGTVNYTNAADPLKVNILSFSYSSDNVVINLNALDSGIATYYSGNTTDKKGDFPLVFGSIQNIIGSGGSNTQVIFASSASFTSSANMGSAYYVFTGIGKMTVDMTAYLAGKIVVVDSASAYMSVNGTAINMYFDSVDTIVLAGSSVLVTMSSAYNQSSTWNATSVTGTSTVDYSLLTDRVSVRFNDDTNNIQVDRNGIIKDNLVSFSNIYLTNYNDVLYYPAAYTGSAVNIYGSKPGSSVGSSGLVSYELFSSGLNFTNGVPDGASASRVNVYNFAALAGTKQTDKFVFTTTNPTLLNNIDTYYGGGGSDSLEIQIAGSVKSYYLNSTNVNTNPGANPRYNYSNFIRVNGNSIYTADINTINNSNSNTEDAFYMDNSRQSYVINSSNKNSVYYTNSSGAISATFTTGYIYVNKIVGYNDRITPDNGTTIPNSTITYFYGSNYSDTFVVQVSASNANFKVYDINGNGGNDAVQFSVDNANNLLTYYLGGDLASSVYIDSTNTRSLYLTDVNRIFGGSGDNRFILAADDANSYTMYGNANTNKINAISYYYESGGVDYNANYYIKFDLTSSTIASYTGGTDARVGGDKGIGTGINVFYGSSYNYNYFEMSDSLGRTIYGSGDDTITANTTYSNVSYASLSYGLSVYIYRIASGVEIGGSAFYATIYRYGLSTGPKDTIYGINTLYTTNSADLFFFAPGLTPDNSIKIFAGAGDNYISTDVSVFYQANETGTGSGALNGITGLNFVNAIVMYGSTYSTNPSILGVQDFTMMINDTINTSITPSTAYYNTNNVLGNSDGVSGLEVEVRLTANGSTGLAYVTKPNTGASTVVSGIDSLTNFQAIYGSWYADTFYVFNQDKTTVYSGGLSATSSSNLTVANSDKINATNSNLAVTYTIYGVVRNGFASTYDSNDSIYYNSTLISFGAGTGSGSTRTYYGFNYFVGTSQLDTFVLNDVYGDSRHLANSGSYMYTYYLDGGNGSAIMDTRAYTGSTNDFVFNVEALYGSWGRFQYNVVGSVNTVDYYFANMRGIIASGGNRSNTFYASTTNNFIFDGGGIGVGTSNTLTYVNVTQRLVIDTTNLSVAAGVIPAGFGTITKGVSSNDTFYNVNIIYGTTNDDTIILGNKLNYVLTVYGGTSIATAGFDTVDLSALTIAGSGITQYLRDGFVFRTTSGGQYNLYYFSAISFTNQDDNIIMDDEGALNYEFNGLGGVNSIYFGSLIASNVSNFWTISGTNYTSSAVLLNFSTNISGVGVATVGRTITSSRTGVSLNSTSTLLNFNNFYLTPLSDKVTDSSMASYNLYASGTYDYNLSYGKDVMGNTVTFYSFNGGDTVDFSSLSVNRLIMKLDVDNTAVSKTSLTVYKVSPSSDNTTIDGKTPYVGLFASSGLYGATNISTSGPINSIIGTTQDDVLYLDTIYIDTAASAPQLLTSVDFSSYNNVGDSLYIISAANTPVYVQYDNSSKILRVGFKDVYGSTTDYGYTLLLNNVNSIYLPNVSSSTSGNVFNGSLDGTFAVYGSVPTTGGAYTDTVMYGTDIAPFTRNINTVYNVSAYNYKYIGLTKMNDVASIAGVMNNITLNTVYYDGGDGSNTIQFSGLGLGLSANMTWDSAQNQVIMKTNSGADTYYLRSFQTYTLTDNDDVVYMGGSSSIGGGIYEGTAYTDGIARIDAGKFDIANSFYGSTAYSTYISLNNLIQPNTTSPFPVTMIENFQSIYLYDVDGQNNRIYIGNGLYLGSSTTGGMKDVKYINANTDGVSTPTGITSFVTTDASEIWTEASIALFKANRNTDSSFYGISTFSFGGVSGVVSPTGTTPGAYNFVELSGLPDLMEAVLNPGGTTATPMLDPSLQMLYIDGGVSQSAERLGRLYVNSTVSTPTTLSFLNVSRTGGFAFRNFYGTNNTNTISLGANAGNSFTIYSNQMPWFNEMIIDGGSALNDTLYIRNATFGVNTPTLNSVYMEGIGGNTAVPFLNVVGFENFTITNNSTAAYTTLYSTVSSTAQYFVDSANGGYFAIANYIHVSSSFYIDGSATTNSKGLASVVFKDIGIIDLSQINASNQTIYYDNATASSSPLISNPLTIIGSETNTSLFLGQNAYDTGIAAQFALLMGASNASARAFQRNTSINLGAGYNTLYVEKGVGGTANLYVDLTGQYARFNATNISLINLADLSTGIFVDNNTAGSNMKITSTEYIRLIYTDTVDSTIGVNNITGTVQTAPATYKFNTIKLTTVAYAVTSYSNTGGSALTSTIYAYGFPAVSNVDIYLAAKNIYLEQSGTAYYNGSGSMAASGATGEWRYNINGAQNLYMSEVKTLYYINYTASTGSFSSATGHVSIFGSMNSSDTIYFSNSSLTRTTGISTDDAFGQLTGIGSAVYAFEQGIVIDLGGGTGTDTIIVAPNGTGTQTNWVDLTGAYSGFVGRNINVIEVGNGAGLFIDDSTMNANNVTIKTTNPAYRTKVVYTQRLGTAYLGVNTSSDTYKYNISNASSVYAISSLNATGTSYLTGTMYAAPFTSEILTIAASTIYVIGGSASIYFIGGTTSALSLNAVNIVGANNIYINNGQTLNYVGVTPIGPFSSVGGLKVYGIGADVNNLAFNTSRVTSSVSNLFGLMGVSSGSSVYAFESNFSFIGGFGTSGSAKQDKISIMNGTNAGTWVDLSGVGTGFSGYNFQSLNILGGQGIIVDDSTSRNIGTTTTSNFQIKRLVGTTGEIKIIYNGNSSIGVNNIDLATDQSIGNYYVSSQYVSSAYAMTGYNGGGGAVLGSSQLTGNMYLYSIDSSQANGDKFVAASSIYLMANVGLYLNATGSSGLTSTKQYVIRGANNIHLYGAQNEFRTLYLQTTTATTGPFSRDGTKSFGIYGYNSNDTIYNNLGTQSSNLSSQFFTLVTSTVYTFESGTLVNLGAGTNTIVFQQTGSNTIALTSAFIRFENRDTIPGTSNTGLVVNMTAATVNSTVVVDQTPKGGMFIQQRDGNFIYSGSNPAIIFINTAKQGTEDAIVTTGTATSVYRTVFSAQTLSGTTNQSTSTVYYQNGSSTRDSWVWLGAETIYLIGPTGVINRYMGNRTAPIREDNQAGALIKFATTIYDVDAASTRFFYNWSVQTYNNSTSPYGSLPDGELQLKIYMSNKANNSFEPTVSSVSNLYVNGNKENDGQGYTRVYMNWNEGPTIYLTYDYGNTFFSSNNINFFQMPFENRKFLTFIDSTTSIGVATSFEAYSGNTGPNGGNGIWVVDELSVRVGSTTEYGQIHIYLNKSIIPTTTFRVPMYYMNANSVINLWSSGRISATGGIDYSNLYNTAYLDDVINTTTSSKMFYVHSVREFYVRTGFGSAPTIQIAQHSESFYNNDGLYVGAFQSMYTQGGAITTINVYQQLSSLYSVLAPEKYYLYGTDTWAYTLETGNNIRNGTYIQGNTSYNTTVTGIGASALSVANHSFYFAKAGTNTNTQLASKNVLVLNTIGILRIGHAASDGQAAHIYLDMAGIAQNTSGSGTTIVNTRQNQDNIYMFVSDGTTVGLGSIYLGEVTTRTAALGAGNVRIIWQNNGTNVNATGPSSAFNLYLGYNLTGNTSNASYTAYVDYTSIGAITNTIWTNTGSTSNIYMLTGYNAATPAGLLFNVYGTSYIYNNSGNALTSNPMQVNLTSIAGTIYYYLTYSNNAYITINHTGNSGSGAFYLYLDNTNPSGTATITINGISGYNRPIYIVSDKSINLVGSIQWGIVVFTPTENNMNFNVATIGYTYSNNRNKMVFGGAIADNGNISTSFLGSGGFTQIIHGTIGSVTAPTGTFSVYFIGKTFTTSSSAATNGLASNASQNNYRPWAMFGRAATDTNFSVYANDSTRPAVNNTGFGINGDGATGSTVYYQNYNNTMLTLQQYGFGPGVTNNTVSFGGVEKIYNMPGNSTDGTAGSQPLYFNRYGRPAVVFNFRLIYATNGNDSSGNSLIVINDGSAWFNTELNVTGSTYGVTNVNYTSTAYAPNATIYTVRTVYYNRDDPAQNTVLTFYGNGVQTYTNTLVLDANFKAIDTWYVGGTGTLSVYRNGYAINGTINGTYTPITFSSSLDLSSEASGGVIVYGNDISVTSTNSIHNITGTVWYKADPNVAGYVAGQFSVGDNSNKLLSNDRVDVVMYNNAVAQNRYKNGVQTGTDIFEDFNTITYYSTKNIGFQYLADNSNVSMPNNNTNFNFIVTNAGFDVDFNSATTSIQFSSFDNSFKIGIYTLRFSSIDNIVGTSYDDVFDLSSGNASMFAATTINSGYGNDTFIMGSNIAQNYYIDGSYGVNTLIVNFGVIQVGAGVGQYSFSVMDGSNYSSGLIFADNVIIKSGMSGGSTFNIMGGRNAQLQLGDSDTIQVYNAYTNIDIVSGTNIHIDYTTARFANVDLTDSSFDNVSKLTGSNYDDVFHACLDGSNSSLFIDGKGGYDVLNLTGAVDTTSLVKQISGIESINFSKVTNTDITFNADDIFNMMDDIESSSLHIILGGKNFEIADSSGYTVVHTTNGAFDEYTIISASDPNLIRHIKVVG